MAESVDDEIWVAYILNGGAAAAWTVFAWNFLITFDDEVEHIWHCKSSMRWLYFFMRYFGLCMHIVHCILTVAIHSHQPGPPPASICKRRYVVETVAAEVLVASVECLLAIQACVLYNRTRHIAITLLTLLSLKALAVALLMWFAKSHITWGSLCMGTLQPHTLIYLVYGSKNYSILTTHDLFYSLAGLFPQAFIWVLTIYRYHAVVAEGWGRTPVVYLLIRDGSCAFVALFAVLSVQLLLSVLVNHSLGAIGNPWIISMMSISGCRIIVNMQQLGAREVSCDDCAMHLQHDISTTQISTIIF